MAKKTTKPTAVQLDDPYVVNTINLRKSAWDLLRRVANARGDIDGGRRSMSGVIQKLIDDNKAKFEKEVKDGQK